MEFRKVFDTILEQFDRYRPRYSPELFAAFLKDGSFMESENLPLMNMSRSAERIATTS